MGIAASVYPSDVQPRAPTNCRNITQHFIITTLPVLL